MVAAGELADGFALSVHGPAGVLDLRVPAGALVRDVAREYADHARLGAEPALCTLAGAPLRPGSALAEAGLRSGAVVVVTPPSTPASGVRAPGARTGRPAGQAGRTAGRRSLLPAAVVCVVASVAALAGGWLAAVSDDETLRVATVAVLAVASLIGVLPGGRLAPARAVAAPAFAAAATLPIVWDTLPERVPTVVGVCALAAAVVAAVARSFDRRAEEALAVWIVVGSGIFVITGLAALAGLPPRAVWAVLLVLATLAARVVPGFAVDVPDQLLVDLERLAVTAWSARERPSGRRGRTIVRPKAVAAVAERGTRLVLASCAAVLGVSLLAAPLLLDSATWPLDRLGARILVGAAGAGLLLAGRSYRHPVARALLRLAGLACWGFLLASLLPGLDGGRSTAVAVAALLVGVLLVVVAVATGRGWRSAWWSRRAEIAEGLAGAVLVASVLVATGVFRKMWELAWVRFSA
ncbi:hypothetical protein [Nocardioides ferulae]|uniref:hypothetical protein n=1 Tax=Nocardioides ferulae TaxID=2340821 RepID=UPI000EAD83E3|nr:hypothetical protein [Nocardioides ferulae]